MLKEKLYSEYQRRYKEYKEKQRRVENLRIDVENIIAEGEMKSSDIETQEKNELVELSDKEKELERELASVKKDENSVLKPFDEDQLRQKLVKDKEREVAKFSEQYDASISQTQEDLQGIDSEYADILQEELSHIEKDENLCEVYTGLSEKADSNELPPAITDVMSEPITDVIQRNEIDGGQKLAQIVSNVKSLDDYTPEWLTNLVNLGLPLLVGVGLLLFFIFSGTHFYFVATATNAVVTFLLWIVVAAIIGGIAYAIIEAILGFGIAGAVIGAILGFWIATHWSITLPYGVTNVVEWIIKGLVCLAVVVVLIFINSSTSVGRAFINIGMKPGFIRRAALEQQGYKIQENADSYCILIKYKEIIEQIVNENKQQRYDYLTGELERLQAEKASAIEAFSDKIDQETGQTVQNERKQYEQQQNGLARKRERLERNIADCISESAKKKEQYNQKLTSCKQEYEQKAKTVNDNIDKLNAEFAGDLNEIHKLFDNINSNSVGFEESQGVLSDYLYIYNEDSIEDPKSVIEIKHDKKPIVFLYDLDDTTNVSASLFDFMRAVLAGFYTINTNDAFDVIVTDPVSKARKFEQMTKFLTIENDIKKLSDTIQNSMREVAKEGMHIDAHNRKMAAEGEDKVKYFKYKIAEFIVPEESAAQNTNFFDSDLWGTLGDGKENGFIPIFYISYSDWKNTFDDDSKLNSKFILQLKNAIGSSNGMVFKIDAKNITIENVD